MSVAAQMYACLHVREFAAQAVLRLRPELAGKSCVVMEGEAPEEQVCALNTRARLKGVERGMTRVEVESFAEVVVLARSAAMERATRDALLETAGAFTPRVEEVRAGEAFVCVLDIAGTESLFGPAAVLARTLLARVRGLGISARVTVSANFEAAVCLAKGLALHTALQVVGAGEEAAALAALPLHVLAMEDAQRETFATWGVRTLGALAALPESALVARLGAAAQRMHRLARGEEPHLMVPVEIPFALEEYRALDFPLENLESLLFGLSVMLEQLLLRARARLLALASATVVLTLEGGAAHERTVRPALPSADKAMWLKLLQLDLEAHPPPAAIVAVTLRAEPGATSKVQLGLFSPQLPEPGRLDVMLARLAAQVGEGYVGRAVLADTHAPEGFRVEPFVVPGKVASLPQPAQTRAAMRMVRPAERIAVTVREGCPAQFVFRELRYAVERAYGPWLADGEWWAGLWRQEQWDVMARAISASGMGALLCCVLAHDPATQQWTMTALYD